MKALAVTTALAPPPSPRVEVGGACIFVRVIVASTRGSVEYSIAAPPGATVRDVALAAAELVGSEMGGIRMLPDVVTDVSGTMLAPYEPVRVAVARGCEAEWRTSDKPDLGATANAEGSPLLVSLRSTGLTAPVPGSLRTESAPLMASQAAAVVATSKVKGGGGTGSYGR